MWLVGVIITSTKVIVKTLSVEDHLLLIMIKLRLGCSNRDLAYRFNIPQSKVSKIIRHWVPVMSEKLKDLIVWPSREAVRANMPRKFRHKFSHCRCIIDCTEIFIERTYNLQARAETWSNYKSTNTIKYLVAISPAGAITFVSRGWGGRASDKEITNNSGFFNKLEFGDEVLADRGFLIREELAVIGATLKIPSFTRGKSQLSAHEVDTSRQISRVRIHVELVIGRWKNFKILTSVIPISQVDLLDDFVTICAALVNLCPSVVKRKR
ncbi:hypothetical protein CAPTEDRAFT_134641 [Capitella teleta]|uniref:DDE Tnp4 domain-containing protein n=1 Tax=Capitella teleta TaxID=283909 RepID=R7TIM9_CAPTE|nr:hypothetical protein CAPTEDRAFT_134641 [Capitella teleta]|eukprot:ELT93594.1 hypothetical protein CAPTEDRAFT_134641 [Capitella teleta]